MNNKKHELLERYFDDYEEIATNNTIIFSPDNERYFIENLELDEENVRRIKSDQEIIFCFKNKEKEFEIKNKLAILIKEYNKGKDYKITKKEILDKLKSNFIIYESYRTKNKKIEIEDSINYLEKKIGNVAVKTYSINLMELIELYIDAGDKLFDRNVRIGLESKELERSFREVLEKDINKILEKKLIKENNIKSKEFFLYHNGISAVYIGDYEIEKKRIKFSDFDNFSIINGAQTISTITKIYFEAKEEIKKEIKGEKNTLSSIKELDDLFKGIEVQITISFCKLMEEEIINNISKYKNVQIKINGIDTYVQEANEINENYNNTFKIIRPGENVNNNFHLLSMKDLIKKYWIYKLKPGKSKNLKLNSEDIKDFIAEKEIDEFVNFFNI